MSYVPWQYNNGVLTMVLDGRAYQVKANHPNIKKVKEALQKPNRAKDIIKLLNIAGDIKAKSCGKITFNGTDVMYGGRKLNRVEAERIRQFVKDGLPFKPLLNFLNKAKNVDESLYLFLEHKNLPITEDGDFLAYKAVGSDWYDKYSHTIENTPGKTVRIKRAGVDPDRNRDCSFGLHVGAMDYVTWYGKENDRIIIVKVNPANAVAVPTDHDFMKLRVCEYHVLREYDGDLTAPLYTQAGKKVRSNKVGKEEVDDWFANGEVESISTKSLGKHIFDLFHNKVKTFSKKLKSKGPYNKRDSRGRFTR